MSNYSALKTAIQQAVYTNGNNEITGAGLQSVLLQIVNTVGDGYVFKGVATGGTSPGTPDQNVFFVGGAGTYTNFGSSYTVPAGSIGIFSYNGSWSHTKVDVVDANQLSQKLIKLTGFGTNGAEAGVTTLGDVYYNTGSKLLRKWTTGSTPSTGGYDTVPYYPGAIYTYDGSLFIWDGTELRKTTDAEILKDYDILAVCGFGKDSAKGGVTKAGDVFYNTTSNLLRRCVTYTNPYTGTYETVPYDSNTLYLNLSDNCLYRYNGETMVLFLATSFYKSNHIIHLNNIGSGWNPNITVGRLGEVYYNSVTKKLRMCVEKNDAGEVSRAVDVPLYYDALYVFNGVFYKWDGDNLVVVPINSARCSDSSIFMYPGVSSGNGNFWSLVGASLPAAIGEKYGNGFFSLELVEVSIGDVLEINYTKMGIDGTKYKIGIIEYDEAGKYFGPDGGPYNSEPTYYLQDSLVTFQESTKYIRFTAYRLDTSTYELQTEFRMPLFFTKYSSNSVKLVKDFASNGSGTAPSFPYVKGITYPVENTNIVFNNTASLNYKDKSIGFNNGYAIFPEEYTPQGKGFPLILFIHGTEGIDFVNSTSPLYLELLKNVAKGGYIVADCSSLSSFYYNNDEGTTRAVVDANYPEPIAWECYHKLYLYLTRRWNIDESRVYVFGKSAGGLNTIMLSQMGILPIKAAASLAGSVDVITNMRVMDSGPNNINPFLHRIGMTDANLSGQIVGTGDADYLVSHSQDLAGFNPLWFKTVGIDKETQIRRCIADGLNTSTIENDTALQNAVSAASTSLRIPIKWWQAVDDVNVPIGTTRMYQKMVRNGGGIFEIREFPAGCGAHHAVDNAPNAPTTSYTHRNGITVTLPVAYAEVLDWFNLWW